MTKTASFAVVHFTVAFTVGYALTGSVLVGGAIALIEPAINTVAYFIHEKIWDRVRNRAIHGARPSPLSDRRIRSRAIHGARPSPLSDRRIRNRTALGAVQCPA